MLSITRCLHNLAELLEMFKFFLTVCLATSVVAFRPALVARPCLTRLSMNAEGLAGQSAPFGYFDPLGLSNDKSEGDVKVRLYYTWLISLR